MGLSVSLQIIAFLVLLIITIRMWRSLNNGFTRATPRVPGEIMVMAFVGSLILLIAWIGLSIWARQGPIILFIISFAGIAAAGKMMFGSMASIAGWR